MSLELNKDIYKDIKWSFREESSVVSFSINNWIKNKTQSYPRENGMIGYICSEEPVNTYLLPIISQRGGAIWINAKGELSYRFGIDLKTHISTLTKASVAFSNFLDRKVRIGIQDSSVKNDINQTENLTIYLSTNDLYMIEDEQFRPDIRKEFFWDEQCNLAYKNTFIPSKYVRDIFIYEKNAFTSSPSESKNNVILDYLNSTIGEYIFYLAGHEQDRFHFIMTWLATFFQDFSKKSNHTLVLVGKHTSGIEILFEEIIKPLFKASYCVKLDDDRLQSNNLLDFINHKLFYNIDNVSNESLVDNNVSKLLKNLLEKDKNIIDVQYKRTIVETKIFGQVLVTSTEPYLPFIDSQNKNCIVFKLHDDIEMNFRPKINITDDREKIDKKELVDMIRKDLDNFSNLLTLYEPTSYISIKDDKACIMVNKEDKLKSFSNAIVSKTITYFERLQDTDSALYEDIMNDFDKNRIKQSNLKKCYSAIYGKDDIHSSKKLMLKLREENNSFFAINAIESGAGGIKYFIYK